MAAFAQRHRLEELDTGKPEGKALQQALAETDEAKKATLLEQYVADFPKSDGTAFVLELLQAYYVKSEQPDKVISTGEKLQAIDPTDLDAVLPCLKAAESKKDPALIVKWAAATSALARKIAEKPKPAGEDEAATWKADVEYAKQVDGYSDYALYRAAVESTDPKVTISLLETLRQQNPKSEYVAKSADPLFMALRQTGAKDQALALAESTLAVEQTNTDMLLLVADNYMQNNKEPEKVHAYAAKMVEIMAQKPKPEGISDADWTARKDTITGLAHYMSGKLYYNENDFEKADQELRAALPLPLVQSSAEMKPEVLFLLGFANFKLKKLPDAAGYFKECAAIKSPYQANAAKNLEGVRVQSRGAK
jgi:tetratricopeptide (TPR) repeat protein